MTLILERMSDVLRYRAPIVHPVCLRKQHATVFSDPVGDKLTFLKEAAQAGHNVVLCFIGIGSLEVCEERVAMRVSQGGYDVPAKKPTARFPRVLANLKEAIHELPHVFIFDNDNLRIPFRLVAVFGCGRRVILNKPVPKCLKPLLV